MFTKTIKGVSVPSIGLGTFELVGEAGTAAIRAAIEHGYRHIDTAIRYGNEREVGDAIRACGVDRKELFVTTKIWFTDLVPEMVHQRVSESMAICCWCIGRRRRCRSARRLQRLPRSGRRVTRAISV